MGSKHRLASFQTFLGGIPASSSRRRRVKANPRGTVQRSTFSVFVYVYVSLTHRFVRASEGGFTRMNRASPDLAGDLAADDGARGEHREERLCVPIVS